MLVETSPSSAASPPGPEQALFRAVVEALAVGAVVFDPSRAQIVYRNAAWLELTRGALDGAALEAIARTLAPGATRGLRLGARPLTVTSAPLGGGLLLLQLLDAPEPRRPHVPELLLQSAEFFHATASAAADAILLLGDESEILYSNAMAEAMFDRTSDELLGRPARELFAPEVQSCPIPIRYALPLPPPGAGRPVECVAVRRADERFPVELSSAVFRLRDRWHAVVIVRDITERKRTEEALQRSSELFRTVADLASDWSYWRNPARQLLYVAPIAQELSGYAPQDFVADPCLLDRIVHEDDRERWLAHVREEEEERRPAPLHFRIHTRHGEVRWMHHVCRRIEGADDTFLGIRASNRDVTRLREQQQTNERLIAAIESTAESICITDGDGRLQYANRSFETVTGCPQAEAIGRPLREFICASDDHSMCELIFASVRRGEPWTGVVESKRRDGTPYRSELTVAPVQSLHRSESNYVAVSRDVTERDRLLSVAEAVTTMKSIGYVVSGIRHELGNPINSIKMALTVLRHNLDAWSAGQIREYVDRSLAEFARVEYLLRALKNFNLYETPEPRAVPLGPFLVDLHHLVSSDFERRGIRVGCIPHDDVGAAHTDPRALQQVLLNVLANAADAVEGVAQPTITLSAFRSMEGLVIQVVDNGVGMTEDHQKSLFRPFFTTKAQGTGLGMVISRNMLNRMGGDITITSEQHAGTIVELSLPGARGG